MRIYLLTSPLDNLTFVCVLVCACVCRAHAQWCKAQLLSRSECVCVCCAAALFPCYPVCDAYFIGGETPAWGDTFRTHALINPGQPPAFHTSINLESHTLQTLCSFHFPIAVCTMDYYTSLVVCVCVCLVCEFHAGWKGERMCSSSQTGLACHLCLLMFPAKFLHAQELVCEGVSMIFRAVYFWWYSPSAGLNIIKVD